MTPIWPYLRFKPEVKRHKYSRDKVVGNLNMVTVNEILTDNWLFQHKYWWCHHTWHRPLSAGLENENMLLFPKPYIITEVDGFVKITIRIWNYTKTGCNNSQKKYLSQRISVPKLKSHTPSFGLPNLKNAHKNLSIRCNIQYFFRTNYYSIERFSHGVTTSCLYFTEFVVYKNHSELLWIRNPKLLLIVDSQPTWSSGVSSAVTPQRRLLT